MSTFIVWLPLTGQRGKILDFNQRLEISIDVAHALTYLHLYAGEKLLIYLICSLSCNRELHFYFFFMFNTLIHSLEIQAKNWVLFLVRTSSLPFQFSFYFSSFLSINKQIEKVSQKDWLRFRFSCVNLGVGDSLRGL